MTAPNMDMREAFDEALKEYADLIKESLAVCPFPSRLGLYSEFNFGEPINLEPGRVFYISEKSFVGRLVIGEKLGENAEAELYSARVNRRAVEKIALNGDTKCDFEVLWDFYRLNRRVLEEISLQEEADCIIKVLKEDRWSNSFWEGTLLCQCPNSRGYELSPDLMPIILGQNSHELVCQSFQGPQRGSHPEFVGGFKDVYRRQGIRGYMANIRPSKWKLGDVWLGNFNTKREAASVRDAVLFYTGQDVRYNYPELKIQEFCVFPQLPRFIQPDFYDSDLGIFKNSALNLGASCGLKNSAKGGESSNPSAVLSESEKIEHVDFKVDADPVTNPLIAANKIDGKLEENDYLNKAVKADANGCDSASQPSEELDGSHECTDDTESEDEGLSSGSSSESQAEVTGDSPGHKTNSNCVGRKRLYGSIDQDDIITMLAPLLKQQIEDALKSTLLPLVAILRSREEDEQKHRVQMLALEEQKLALKREKLLFKRRRVDRT